MARGKVSGRYSPARDGQEDESTRWLGTYGDAVTLLMAFFVMLYAMSQIDQAKFEAFVSGLEQPFRNQASTELLDASPSIVGDAGAEVPAADPGALTTPVVQDLPAPAADQPPDAPADPAAGQTQELDQLVAVKEGIAAALASEGLADLADLAVDDRGLIVSISADQVLFATGSTDISELGRRVIGAVAEPLRDAGNELLVEGHTDDVPLRRPGYTNWNLSTDRAVAVLTMLHAEMGIAPQRLGAVGYGEFRPRVPNTGAENRSLNRRVDIQIAALGKDPR